jgi:hypothetical protein
MWACGRASPPHVIPARGAPTHRHKQHTLPPPPGAHTLQQQTRTLCLSPDGQLLLAIDESGRALLIARQRRVLLHHFSFKGPVAAAAFSPDGQYVAAAVGRLLQVCGGVREGGCCWRWACGARPRWWQAVDTAAPPHTSGAGSKTHTPPSPPSHTHTHALTGVARAQHAEAAAADAAAPHVRHVRRHDHRPGLERRLALCRCRQQGPDGARVLARPHARLGAAHAGGAQGGPRGRVLHGAGHAGGGGAGRAAAPAGALQRGQGRRAVWLEPHTCGGGSSSAAATSRRRRRRQRQRQRQRRRPRGGHQQAAAAAAAAAAAQQCGPGGAGRVVAGEPALFHAARRQAVCCCLPQGHRGARGR